VTVDDHGQSRATIDKERRIGALLATNMRIIGRRFGGSRFRYFHFDANAGSGWNDLIDVPGSPRVFWDLADQYLQNMPFRAFFAEIIKSRTMALLQAIPPAYKHCSFVFPSDNEEVLQVFAECIRRYERPDKAMGSILIDPNGWFYRNAKGEGPPLAGLRDFANEFPRIDIALNINSRTYQLQHASGHNVQSPEDVLQSLNKNHWLVSEATYGHSRFLLAVGRNFNTGSHRGLGMHALDSAEGRYIMNRAEGGRQGGLFDALAI
jgi:hypothetical protein